MLGTEQSEPFHPLVLRSSQRCSLCVWEASLEHARCLWQGKIGVGAGKIRSECRWGQQSPVTLGFWSLCTAGKSLGRGDVVCSWLPLCWDLCPTATVLSSGLQALGQEGRVGGENCRLKKNPSAVCTVAAVSAMVRAWGPAPLRRSDVCPTVLLNTKQTSVRNV